ncbi:TcpQ domain-containing protein [Dickeya oryzae]|uniref:TcpQ domain-containing protein n=1 Tax=Dickeya oryzae TaxID=1240404 RepID=A0AB39IJ20_9GAMM|nr:TcpQ domain-containing protein [Dickeya oryzae]MCA6990828.1 TcpQ domain-containing protein [Dickeya oryzae]
MEKTLILSALSLPLLLSACAETPQPSPYRVPPRVNDIYQRSPEVVRYDRYTLVNTRPADSQRDPLNQIVDITMPTSIVKSVGDGFRYLLLESGYSLCPSSSPVFSELLSRPLPAVQRSIGPVRLSEALQIVAGQAWRLRIDEVNREICFVLRDEYRSFAVSTPVVATAKTVSAPVSATASTVQSPQKFLLKPDSQPLPPLPSAKTLSTQPSSTTAASTATTAASAPVKSFDLPPYNPNQKVSANSAQKATQKVSGGTTHVPTTALPPAPAAAVQPQSARPTQTQTPVAASVQPAATPPVPMKLSSSLVPAAQTGPTWKADVGSTLKETLTKWATQAKCDTNGGNWVVIWPVAVDYRIDAPLSFHGNFESVLVQIFDLYRRAEKPLFAEASRMQCLVSVSDTPVSGAGR